MANLIANVIECDIIASRFKTKTKQAAYFHCAEEIRMTLRNDLRIMVNTYDKDIGTARVALFSGFLSESDFKAKVLAIRQEYKSKRVRRLGFYAAEIQMLLGEVGNMKSDQIKIAVRNLHAEGITRND